MQLDGLFIIVHRVHGRDVVKLPTEQDPETGEWMHERIILYPLNPDYQPIEIRDEEGFIVVGEFIGIVK